MTAQRQPEEVVLQFNKYINSRDIEGLSSLLADGHRFVDSTGNTFQGKDNAIKAWREFFRLFSDYKNIFESIDLRGGIVVITGRSVCSDERLNELVLWTARIEKNKIAE